MKVKNTTIPQPNVDYVVFNFNIHNQSCKMWSDQVECVFLRSGTVATIIFGACFCVATIRGGQLFPWKALRYQ